MRVHVTFYGGLKQDVGAKRQTVELPGDAQTVGALVEALEAGEVEVFTVPAPAAPRNGWDGAPEGGAAPVNLPLPFSKDKRVSLVVVDEGAPEPSCGHTKYAIGLDKIAFLLHYYTLPTAPEQLTEAKLRRLPKPKRLATRVALVTGGAQGFGRAITERFAASGAKVAIWDFDQTLAEKTAKEIGAAVIALEVDVTDPGAVEAARDAKFTKEPASE